MLDVPGGRQPQDTPADRLKPPAVIPRLLPDEPLPPYRHVPGRTPHPFSDPGGHGHRLKTDAAIPLDPEQWHRCRPFLYGIDLFNHGFYWEAHEAWEELWRSAGRKGVFADFLKALIKLAAAGVKQREGKPIGVRSHARRAAELFRKTAALQAFCPTYMGLHLGDLIRFAEELQQGPCPHSPSEVDGPVFSFTLTPALN